MTDSTDLLITRYETGEEGTFGSLQGSGWELELATVELPWTVPMSENIEL